MTDRLTVSVWKTVTSSMPDQRHCLLFHSPTIYLPFWIRILYCYTIAALHSILFAKFFKSYLRWENSKFFNSLFVFDSQMYCRNWKLRRKSSCGESNNWDSASLSRAEQLQWCPWGCQCYELITCIQTRPHVWGRFAYLRCFFHSLFLGIRMLTIMTFNFYMPHLSFQ